MNEKAFIKVPRGLFSSAFYEDKELFHFCVTLLELARFSPVKIDGIDVKTGQVLTTGSYLCQKCRLTRGKMRTYLKQLTDSGFISCKPIKNKYTLITINMYVLAPKYINGIKC